VAGSSKLTLTTPQKKDLLNQFVGNKLVLGRLFDFMFAQKQEKKDNLNVISEGQSLEERKKAS